jgi:excinuclease UvrABC nuclease subunit
VTVTEAQAIANVRDVLGGRVIDATESLSIDPDGHFVYLLWDHDPTTPLYVGKSSCVLTRLATHMRDKRQTRRVQLIPCATPSEMAATEARLIRQYRPRLNVVGKR